MSADAMVCYARCWSCSFGHHYDPPEWHMWADFEDIEHNPAVADSPCACPCAGVVPIGDE